MSLKKMIVSGAAALALMGSAAYAVTQVAEDGTGDYLLAPVYYTTSNWQTDLKVVNTNTTNAVVAKVVIRDRKDSAEVIDFPIYLTPGDVWTGTLYWGSDGRLHVKSSDDSMMVYVNGTLMNGANQTIDLYPTDPNLVGKGKIGYVEVFGLAQWNATLIDPAWTWPNPLNKTAFFNYVRSPLDNSLHGAGAQDVGNNVLAGKQTIYYGTPQAQNELRYMSLNMYALEGVSENPDMQNVLNVDTKMGPNGNVARRATSIDEMDDALRKIHIYAMYEGDGTTLYPFRVHFTAPTKKYHALNTGTASLTNYGYTYDGTGTDVTDYYYFLDTQTTIIKDNSENPHYCHEEYNETIDDVSGTTEQNQTEECPKLPLPYEVSIIDGDVTLINGPQGAFAEGGYIDFDLTPNVDENGKTGMPVVPTSFNAKGFDIGGQTYYLNNHLYNQYLKEQSTDNNID